MDLKGLIKISHTKIWNQTITLTWHVEIFKYSLPGQQCISALDSFSNKLLSSVGTAMCTLCVYYCGSSKRDENFSQLCHWFIPSCYFRQYEVFGVWKCCPWSLHCTLMLRISWFYERKLIRILNRQPDGICFFKIRNCGTSTTLYCTV